MDPAALQNQIALLQQQVSLLTEALGQTREALAQARVENTLLRQKLDALARRLFGKKSEQLDAAQLQLLLAGLTQQIVEPAPPKSLLPVAAPRRQRQTPQRIITPESLEVVREVIEPDEVQAQPEHWKRIAEEVSRQLDFQPAKFFWREIVRPKYVRTDDRSRPPVVAPAPVRVADGSLAAPGLLAHLLVSKYADHLPFYRLQMMFWQRQGVFIARQQMVLWVGQCVVWLEAIVVCLKKELQQSPYVQVDETPVRYLDPETPGQCAQGYLWTGLVPGKCVVYEWHASRAAACLDSLLGKDFRASSSATATARIPRLPKTRKTWRSSAAGRT